MVDYHKSAKETEGSAKAWRTGALKAVLTLLIKEYGKEKVTKELEGLPSKPFDLGF